MELKTARKELVLEETAQKSSKKTKSNSQELEKISLDEILKLYSQKGEHFFYFDNSNSHKDMQKAKSALEKGGLRVQLNEVRYGLDENNYIYEIYII